METRKQRIERLPSFDVDFAALGADKQKQVLAKILEMHDESKRAGFKIRRFHARNGKVYTDKIFYGRFSIWLRFTFHWREDPRTKEQIIVLRHVGGHEIYANP